MSAGATGQEAASASASRDQITVLAQFVAKPGRESDICGGLLRLVEAARAEPDNLSYDLHRLDSNPAVFYVLANWADQVAFDRHMANMQTRAFLDGQAVSDLAAPPMLTYAQPLSRPDARPDRPRTPGQTGPGRRTPPPRWP